MGEVRLYRNGVEGLEGRAVLIPSGCIVDVVNAMDSLTVPVALRAAASARAAGAQTLRHPACESMVSKQTNGTRSHGNVHYC